MNEQNEFKGAFITGTDTSSGKTTAAVGLLCALRRYLTKAVGFKPVATGAVNTPRGLRNDDAMALQANSYVKFPYELINPYCYEPPIAPHFAAKALGNTISLPHILSCFEEIKAQSDVVIVEGAGGWRVPLSRSFRISELACAMNLPVVLVVGLRLGCINHALLTAEALQRDGLTFSGWIGVQCDAAYGQFNETCETLAAELPPPCLGLSTYQVPMNFDAVADQLLSTGLASWLSTLGFQLRCKHNQPAI